MEEKFFRIKQSKFKIDAFSDKYREITEKIP